MDYQYVGGCIVDGNFDMIKYTIKSTLDYHFVDDNTVCIRLDDETHKIMADVDKCVYNSTEYLEKYDGGEEKRYELPKNGRFIATSELVFYDFRIHNSVIHPFGHPYLKFVIQSIGIYEDYNENLDEYKYGVEWQIVDIK